MWYLQEHSVIIARIVDRLVNVNRTSVCSNAKVPKTALVVSSVPMANASTKACHLKANVRLILTVKEKDTVRMGLVFWNARKKQKINVQINSVVCKGIASFLLVLNVSKIKIVDPKEIAINKSVFIHVVHQGSINIGIL